MKPGLIAFFVVSFVGLSFAAQARQHFTYSVSTPEPSQKYSPEKMRQRQEAEQVIAQNKEKLLRDPDDVKAHKEIGNAYLFLEEYEAAYNSFKEALRVTPNDAEAYWGMGQDTREQATMRRLLTSTRRQSASTLTLVKPSLT